jgi:hypothetical protein
MKLFLILCSNTNSLFIFFSGILTPLIALISVYIAYQQYVINKNMLKHDSYKLKRDSYDRRYHIFQIIKEFPVKMYENGNIEPEEWNNFKAQINERKFLFDKGTNKFLEDLINKAFEMHQSYDFTRNPNNLKTQEMDQELAKYQELARYFKNLKYNIEDEFIKYLSLDL